MNDDYSMASVIRRGRGAARFAVAFAALTVAGCVTAPPVQEMSDARQAIAAAAEADADRLAAETFSEAQRYLAEAERLLRQESYGAARANAIRARDRAIRALSSIQAAAEREEGAEPRGER